MNPYQPPTQEQQQQQQQQGYGYGYFPQPYGYPPQQYPPQQYPPQQYPPQQYPNYPQPTPNYQNFPPYGAYQQGGYPPQEAYGGYPPQQAGDQGGYHQQTAAAAATISNVPQVPAEIAKANPAFKRLTVDDKKLFVKCYETFASLEPKFREFSKNPNFKLTFDGSNYGFKGHPNVEIAYKKSNYTDFSIIQKNVTHYTSAMLAWLSDPTNTQVLRTFITAFQSYCNDDINRESFTSVINHIEFRHAPEDDDTSPYWEVLGNKLSFVANVHCTGTVKNGIRNYPQQIAGFYHDVFKLAANLGTPPTQPVRWDNYDLKLIQQ